MAGMFRSSLKVAGRVVAVCLFAVSSAHGLPLTLTLQETGFATLVVNCPGGPPCAFIGTYGTFSTNVVGGTSLATPTSLDLSSLNTSTETAGTLVITLTETGVTSPVGSTSWLQQFVGSFIAGPGVSVSSADFVNGIALPVLTCSSTPCAQVNTKLIGGLTGPYDLTEVITIVSTGVNIFSLDESMIGSGTVRTVAEPISLLLLGVGLIAMGGIRRRRI